MRKFLSYILNNAFALAELLLLARVVLRGLSANPAAAVVSFVYSATDTLISPVNYIFPNIPLGSSIIDLVAISSMVFYAIVFFIIHHILRSISLTE